MRIITYEDNKNEYNSYLKYEELDTLKEGLPNFLYKDFDNIQPINKNMYLRLASKELDRRYNFKGNKSRVTNYLSFPRCCLDNPYDNSIIPNDIKVATFLIAIKLYRDSEKYQNKKDSDIKRERIGRTIETEFKNFVDKNIVNEFFNNDDILDKYIKLYLDKYISMQINICRG